jgi:ubiquinone/menaquinone biosynthesis C-methylase UbiE
LGQEEIDTHNLYTAHIDNEYPTTSHNAAVDSSVKLFSIIFSLQSAQAQESALEKLIRLMKYSGGKISSIGRHSLQLNILISLIMTLREVAHKNDCLSSERVPIAIRDIVEVMFKLNALQLAQINFPSRSLYPVLMHIFEHSLPKFLDSYVGLPPLVHL